VALVVGYGSVMEPGRLQITLDCLDPARVGTFWAAALAYPVPDVEGWHNFFRSQGRTEEDLNATFAIEDPAGVRPRMFFQRVPEPKSVKNRVHLDLAAPAAGSSDRAEEIDAFVDRLTALGAHRLRAVKEDGYFVVMADRRERVLRRLVRPAPAGGKLEAGWLTAAKPAL
jgi:hypothetical protein